MSELFRCPITQTIMMDPVSTDDGHTYERTAIEAWFAQGKDTSPMTNLVLESKVLRPNWIVKRAIEEYYIKQDAKEQYKLGMDLFKTDVKKAKEWLKRASDKSYPPAQTEWALHQDAESAFFLFLSAAKAGFAAAQFHLGMCFLNGKGCTRDVSNAIHWLTAASKQGHVEAMYQCGRTCDDEKQDFKQASLFFQEAAQQGHCEAQYCMGVYAQHGHGHVKKSLVEAQKWFELAIKQDHLKARFCLAEMWLNGKRKQEAMELLELNANKGHLDSQLKLYSLLIKDKNTFRAVHFLEMAALQNNMTAQYALAQHYFDGDGVEKNAKKAAQFCFSAAQQGLVEAEFTYAVCLQTGTGLLQDEKQAIEWFKRASLHGSGMAKTLLGECYLTSRGVACDDVKAKQLFEEAAEQDIPLACWRLAELCQDRDAARAKSLFKKLTCVQSNS